MTRNQYYRSTYKRVNAMKIALYMMFLNISSWPRLTIELFTRRRFGIRYLTLSGTVVFAGLLACYPIYKQTGILFIFHRRSYVPDIDFGELLKHYLTWYAYITGMVYMAIKHRNEVKMEPGEFDYSWFSLSSGIVDARFSV